MRSSSKARLGGPTPTAMIPGSMIKEESSEEEMSFENLNGNSPINNEIEMTTQRIQGRFEELDQIIMQG